MSLCPSGCNASVAQISPPCSSTLVKLRDLAGNSWNVDMLYILAINEGSAGQLAEFARPWLADAVRVHGADETNRALGGGIEQQRLVTVWWDWQQGRRVGACISGAAVLQWE